MRRFLVFLILLTASVWVGVEIAKDPGYLLLVYKQWSIEMPLWFALFAILLIYFVVHFIFKLINAIFSMEHRFVRWLRWRRKNKAYSQTNRGLVDLMEGQWQAAENNLLKGVSQSGAPEINYMAAAEAAEEQGAFSRRENYLRKAEQVAPNSEVAVKLLRAKLQIKHEEIDSALITLRQILETAPTNKLALKMLERLFVRLGKWQELLELLPKLLRAKVVPSAEAAYFEKHIYAEMLAMAELSDAKTVWDSIPRKYRNYPRIVAAYAKKLLNDSSMSTELEALISLALKKGWDDELVRLYGLLVTAYSTKQLATAEKWLRQHPTDAILQLTLARLSFRCQLWGKSRDYYEAYLKTNPLTPGVYLEYGKLLEQLGDREKACQLYQSTIIKY